MVGEPINPVVCRDLDTEFLIMSSARRITLARLLVVSAAVGLTMVMPASAGDPAVVFGTTRSGLRVVARPDCFGPSLLYDYGQQRVRYLVRTQLAAMVASRLESLRVFVVYDYDVLGKPVLRACAVGASRGAVPNESDQLPSRHSRCPSACDARIRSALFSGPRSPLGPYDPATFEASWGLIRDTRPLLKQYGPAETRVDLLNEGAPLCLCPMRESVG